MKNIGFDSKRYAYMKVIFYGHKMFYQDENGKSSSEKISMATTTAWLRERARARARERERETGFDLHRKQFAWKFKACFLGKRRKISPNFCLLNLPREWYRFRWTVMLQIGARPAGTQRWHNVNSTSRHWIDVVSTLWARWGITMGSHYLSLTL